MQSEEKRLSDRLGFPVYLQKEVDSTNLRLKEAARKEEISPPCLLIADRQTMGRGRLGRSFLSPEGGLYMSLLLHRTEAPLTVFAAVAVCRAIEEMTPLKPKIKWVNDLFVNGKKVCGILAEGMESQAVLGIGINLKTPEGGFPGVPVAGALDVETDRLLLARRIAEHLTGMLQNPSDPSVLRDYRERMMLTGKEITYEKDGQQKSARVTGVDEKGGLLVVLPDGTREILFSGEVTLGSGQFLENRQPQ